MAEIIRSYGLFWNESDVFWGAGRQPGKLLGIPASAKRADPIDFRHQIGIYVLYSGHDMIYVGQAGAKNAKLFSRLKKHRKDNLRGRWDRFSWFGLRWTLSRGELSNSNKNTGATINIALNHMEAILITAAEPELNRQGGRFGRGAKRFLQVRDDRLGPTTDQMLRDVWESMSQE